MTELELSDKLGVHRNVIAIWRLKGHIKPYKTYGKGNGTRHLYNWEATKNRLVKAGKLLVDETVEKSA